MLLTNARSLAPKIGSLIEMFDELDLHFAIITESWLKDGQVLNRDVIDLEFGSQLKILYKNRPAKRAGARTVGGGVSIIYSKNRCSFKERRIASGNFEILIACGRINGLNKDVAVFGVYVQPRMKVDELSALRELIAEQVLLLKTNSKGDGPIFFIGGDLNKRDLDPAFSDFVDIGRVNSSATRGNACLDVVYSNTHRALSVNFPPLINTAGTPSDHDCIVVYGDEDQAKNFECVRKARKHSRAACDAFAARIAGTNWESVMGNDDEDADVLIEKFDDYINALVDELFPLQDIRVRTNEAPWITNWIRALSRRKKKAYKRGGKSRHWFNLQGRLTALIDRSRSAFVDKVYSADSNPRSFYKAVKTLSCKESPDEWKVTSLFPGQPPMEAGKKIVDYFTNITKDFSPLKEEDHRPIPRREISKEEVAKKLKLAKKPSSMVPGDLLPRLMKRYHHLLVDPVHKIFNAVFRSSCWPRKWKEETAVIIPKVAAPSTLAECRNISCTSFLSKVLESVLLEDLRSEIPVDPVQYGGLKGCSVDHLLVDAWDAILCPLDAGSHAVMMGLDFEKAFNRLDHGECLKQLAELGASGSSISLVRSFLTRRSVRIRLPDGSLSERGLLNGGSPQGSILGCLLYCLATQQISKNLPPSTVPPRPPLTNTRDAPNLSPNSADSDDEGFNLMPDLDREEDRPDLPSPEQRAPTGPNPLNALSRICMVKYIDDTTTIEAIPGEEAIKHFSSTAPTEMLTPKATEDLASRIDERTKQIGMRLNCRKTQLLCISLDNGCITTANLRIGDQTIECSCTLKLLGYMFGRSADASPQFEYIRKKFRGRFWSLIHWRKAGITGMRLFRLYAIFVRPSLKLTLSSMTQCSLDTSPIRLRCYKNVCCGSASDWTPTTTQHARSITSRHSRKEDVRPGSNS